MWISATNLYTRWVRVEICTGCHARNHEEGFEDVLAALEEHLGVGYFGGFSRDYSLEVDFVSCLDHCNQGFSIALDGETIVLRSPQEQAELIRQL